MDLFEKERLTISDLGFGISDFVFGEIPLDLDRVGNRTKSEIPNPKSELNLAAALTSPSP